MRKYFKASVLFFLLIINFLGYFHAIAYEGSHDTAKGFDAVEHKNLQLDWYLDLIRYNTQEKIGILPYIIKNPEGTYLEIGTGGDPIAEIFSHVSPTSQITLVASDIDGNVLKALPRRHPKLQHYLEAKEGPKLKIMQLDATDMSVFKDNTLSGINASSLVHEIISYAGGFDGMAKFFREARRTLIPNGILVYRDPESVSNHTAPMVLTLKNKNVRLFAHIFLYKFLDTRGSSLGKAGRKFCMYEPKDVMFTFFKKSDPVATSLTYEEYLNIPSYDIDFSRKYIITLPCGLYRELARHYLTYLHQCNPLVFVKCTPDILSGQQTINYLAHSTNELFASFLMQNNQILYDGKIDVEEKIKLDEHIESIMRVLEFGVPLHFSSKRDQSALRTLLQQHGFTPHTYIITINNEDCLLDYRVFGLLYDEINQFVFDNFNGVADAKDEQHAKWLKREGEESYFYLSTDELITSVMRITQTKQIDMQGNESIFVLCPISADDNKFIERVCYSEVLRNALEVQDDHGYDIDVIDGKRVIHFSKMLLQDAIDVCSDIIKKEPMKYKQLTEYIHSLQVHD